MYKLKVQVFKHSPTIIDMVFDTLTELYAFYRNSVNKTGLIGAWVVDVGGKHVHTIF